jgi:hypothetical protein
VTIGEKAGWAPETVFLFQEKRKIFCPLKDIEYVILKFQ